MKALEKIEKVIFRIYEFVLKEKLGESTRIFIRNFNYIFIGLSLSTLFGFFSQILIGRFLGPNTYGRYALVQSISMFIYVPMNLGVSTALIKYNAEKDDIERQKIIISTSFFIIFILSFVFSILLFVFAKQISDIFGVPVCLIFFSILFALFYNLHILGEDVLRSLHKMKEFSIFRVIGGFLMLALIVFFIFNKNFSFEVLIYIVYATYFIIFLSIVLYIRKYLLFSFSNNWLKKIIKYGFYATIGSATYIFLLNFNKIIINKYLKTVNLGIYNAYYFSSIGVLGILLGMFIAVFFPMASKYQNKKIIFEKIDKFLPTIFFIGIPIIFVIEFITLKLYGNKYPINIYLMIEFVITGMLIVSYNFYDYLFASQGILGIKFVALSGIIMSLVNMILSFCLIPLLGLHGAVISLSIPYFLGICNYGFLRKKLFNNLLKEY